MEVLRKAHAKPFLLHASHRGPSVMLSHLQTCMGLIWPKRGPAKKELSQADLPF